MKHTLLNRRISIHKSSFDNPSARVSSSVLEDARYLISGGFGTFLTLVASALSPSSVWTKSWPSVLSSEPGKCSWLIVIAKIQLEEMFVLCWGFEKGPVFNHGSCRSMTSYTRGNLSFHCPNTFTPRFWLFTRVFISLNTFCTNEPGRINHGVS